MKVRRLRSNDPDQLVFLNIAFHPSKEDLLVAYIAGLCRLGLSPRSVLDVPNIGMQDRLEKIIRVIDECGASIHDLSFRQLDKKTRAPRFNMPFELGLAVALSRDSAEKSWYVCDEEPYGITQTISDLNGYESYSHGNEPDGVLDALQQMFHRKGVEFLQLKQTQLLLQTYRVHSIAGSVFTAKAFGTLCVAGSQLAQLSATGG